MKTDIAALLLEKAKHYGKTGGFYENNALDNISHAVGETKLKLGEYQRVNHLNRPLRRRLLVKALTWIYLIYEMEIQS